MHCYSFENPYEPGVRQQGTPVMAVLPKMPNAPRATVRLANKPVKTFSVKYTRFIGEKLMGSDWSLHDFVDSKIEAPRVLSTFTPNLADEKALIACEKAVRAVTGYGIFEAKEFVEAMATINAVIEIVDFVAHPSC